MQIAGGLENLPMFGGPTLGAANPAVQKMQTALKNLAQVSGKPAIDPGYTDGVVGPKTRVAVVAAMSLLLEHLGTAGGVLQTALAVGALTGSGDQYIIQYAPQIEKAAIAAAFKIAQGNQPVPTTPTSPTTTFPSMGTPWYKTWWGITGIAFGSVGVLALIVSLASPPRKAAP